MKILAVICEYNPFHNGHAYQLKKQKEMLGCDGVICLMSGSFVQRGEPAVFDKWARSKMALSGGCDLVLELPVLYALQSAEGFARGGVSLLSKLAFNGYLGFGSESGNLKLLQAAAEVSELPQYHEAIKQRLTEGVSYSVACQEALDRLLPDDFAEPLLPNDILGIEYCKALQNQKSNLQPALLRRIGGMHDSTEPENGYLSATGIRSYLAAGKDVAPFMPPEAYQILTEELAAGRGPTCSGGLDPLVRYVLHFANRSYLAGCSGVSEGLEKRLQDAGKTFQSFQEIAEAAKTKRYPVKRIQRAMLNILLGITKEDENLRPAYARVLGMNQNGANILRRLQRTSEIPFITKVANASLKTEEAKRLFDLDLRATDLYSLLYPQKKAGENGMDFYRSPVLLGLE